MEPGSALISFGRILYKALSDANTRKDQVWFEKCVAEATQVGQTVAIALIAAAKGSEPLDDDVHQFVRTSLDDGTFLPRCHRLFTECLRSPSARRRKRLASVLVGGPHVTRGADDRDRLDMLVERLLDDDVDALRHVHELQAAGVHRLVLNDVDLSICLIRDGDSFRLARGMEVFPDALPKRRADINPAWPLLPALAIASLDSAGCVIVREERFFNAVDLTHTPSAVTVTDTGRFLYTSLKRVSQASGLPDGL
jgi:hypothetical protein